MSQDIRWVQRYEHLDRAVTLLHEPFAGDVARLSALEQEGTLHRFEFVLELSWKSMKDYLEHEGQVIHPLTPRQVIKEAFAAGLIADGQVWIDMLDHRNLLSHTYDAATFTQAVLALRDRYLVAIDAWHAWLGHRMGQT